MDDKKTRKSQFDGAIEAIPDTPENIARAISQGSPKKEWRFMTKESEDSGE